VHELDELTDQAWAKLAPHLAGKLGDVGRSGENNRLFLNAVFWVARHGCAWRALPARFGKYDTVRKRSRRWAQKGVWARLFTAVQAPDLDWVLLDSTIVRAHAQAAGSRKKAASATRPSGAAAAA
jgi:transposase